MRWLTSALVSCDCILDSKNIGEMTPNRAAVHATAGIRTAARLI